MERNLPSNVSKGAKVVIEDGDYGWVPTIRLLITFLTMHVQNVTKIKNGEGDDTNIGDASGDFVGGSGDDKINSGKGNDINFGDTVGEFSEGSGDDKINAGQGDDQLTGNGGADKFQCGSGEDTVTDFNPDEGDKATGNCENI
jgi:Ca2+-binding RTX toxin-like protein